MKTAITGCILAFSLTACMADQDQKQGASANNTTDNGSSNIPNIPTKEDFALQVLPGIGALMYPYDTASLEISGPGCQSNYQNYMGNQLIGEVSIQLQCVVDHVFWELTYDIRIDTDIIINWSVDDSGNGSYGLGGSYTFIELSENGDSINTLRFTNLDMVRTVSGDMTTEEFYFNLSQITRQFGASSQTYESIEPFTYIFDEDKYSTGKMNVTSDNGDVKTYQLNADYFLEQI